MPSYTDSEDEILSDPDDDQSSAASGASGASGEEHEHEHDEHEAEPESQGRGASTSFTSAGTAETSTRTSASGGLGMGLGLGQQEEDDGPSQDSMSGAGGAGNDQPAHGAEGEPTDGRHDASHQQDAEMEEDDDDEEATEGQGQDRQMSQRLLGGGSANDEESDGSDTEDDAGNVDDAKGKEEGGGEGEILTAPDDQGPPQYGPTGTIVRRRGGSSAAAAGAKKPASAADHPHDDVDKGSEGDDESGDDDDDKEKEQEDESSDEEESSSDEGESEDDDEDEDEDDDDGTLNSHEKKRARILRVSHKELTNMGAALRCPICLHTLRRPAVLPCFHAFCYTCINDSLDAERKQLADGNNNKKKKPSAGSEKSPQITYCDKCPTCKIKITKRSITVSDHLEDVAKSYKMVLPTFGMAPIEYDPQVEMTQYVPSDVTDEDDDEDYDGWGGGRRRCGTSGGTAGTEVNAAAELTQISKAMAQALNHDDEDEEEGNAPAARATRSGRAAAGAALSAARERMEQMQKDMKKRANKNKAADVDRVVVANERHEMKARKQHDANEERRRSLDAATAAGEAETEGEGATIDTGSTTTAGIPGETAKEPSASAVAAAEQMEIDNIEEEEEEEEKEEEKDEKPLSEEEKAVAAAEEAHRNYLESAKKVAPQRPWFRDSSVPNADESEVAASVAVPAAGSANKKDISDITTDSTILRGSGVGAGAADAEAAAQSPTPAKEMSPPASQDTNEQPFEAHPAIEDVDMMFGDDDEETEMPGVYDDGATLTQDVREKEAADRSGEMRDSQSEQLLQDIIDNIKESNADQVEPGASQLSLSAPDPGDDNAPSEREEQGDEEMEELQPVPEEEPQDENQDGEQGDDAEAAAADTAVAASTAADTAVAAPTANGPLAASSHEEIPEEVVAAANPTDTPEKQGEASNAADSANLLLVGTVVQVQERMWAGINKPGGVARITKVHPSDNGAKYNVRYVLGGQEKDVDAIYVKAHEEGQEEFTSPAKKGRGAASAQGGPSSGPTRRGGRTRRAAATSKPSAKLAKENKTPSPSAYMPSGLSEKAALKKAMTDSLQIGTKSRARTSSLSQNSDQDAGTTSAASSSKQKQKKRGSKRSKATSNDDNSKKPAAKKQKKPAADESESALDSIPENMDVEVDTAAVAMTASTKLHLADVRYKELLENKQTIHVITSSLSHADKEALENTIQELKKAGVTIKVMKDFKPHVTDLCITARADTNDAPDNYVLSKFRTLKAMRSALAGIPIVTPDWLRACLDEGEFVTPADNNCIRTLPTKSDITHLLPMSYDESTHSGPTAWLGVAKYAALLQRQSEGAGEQYEHRPLINTSVLLCGQFKKGTGVPPKADLVTLLRDCGANVLGTVAAMNKELKNTDDDSTLVVLCDDAKSDKQSGITTALSKAMTAALNDEDEGRRIMVVTFSWLFDSVSCGESLDADNYKPHSPVAKSLWELSTN